MKIISIPCSEGGLMPGRGSEKAPEKIVPLLKQFYANEEGQTHSWSEEKITVVKNNIQETFSNIKKNIPDDKFIVIGGDHSITYPVFAKFLQANPNSAIIIFDAHPDMMQSFEVPTHENWLRMLVEENKIKPEQLFLVGLRNWDKEEYNFLFKHKIQIYPMNIISQDGIIDVCDHLMSKVKEFPALYVSIDIDVLDCAFAPGTGYPEPGGLTTRELLYFLQRLKKLKNFHSCDLVEVNPDKDMNDLTSKTAAKIVFELL
ncbi:arginase family protein [Candidatus Woesearchaeota archaeon]|nr:arginase family protein [Candidatus Woesearchaeota archaeon]